MTGFYAQTTLKLGGAVWLAAVFLLAGPVSGQQGATSDRQDPTPERQLNSPLPDNQQRAGVSGATTFDTLPDSPDEWSRSIEQAERTVRALQAEGGVYASGLADALIELGLAYRGAVEHEKAVTAFREALQAARVNHGLHDLRQLPYLNRVIEQNAILGRWDKVGSNYHYLYRIHKRNYGDKDPRLLPVIEGVVLAKLDIHKTSPTTPIAIGLQDDLRLLHEATEIIDLHYNGNVDRMADTLYLIARSNYEIALQTGKLFQFARYKRTSRTGSIFVDGDGDQPFHVLSRTERDGRSALQRIEELFEERAPSRLLPRALAIARQGDWQQLYRNGSGRRHYKRAYALLEELEGGENHIARIFGEPRLLPAMDPWRQGGRADNVPEWNASWNAEDRLVELTFDVAASGTPQNIRTRSAPEHLKEEAEQWRRHIETWRFRPRMEAGEPVSTRLVQRLLITGEGRAVRLEAEPERLKLADTEH